MNSLEIATKPIILALAFAAVTSLTSCGNARSENLDSSIKGPVITGSSHKGAFMTFVASDSSIQSNSLHYYDFSTGSISQISSAEGRDPVAYWSSSSSLLAYFVRSEKTFRVFKLSDDEASDVKSGVLTTLGEGDPVSLAETSNGEIVLSNLHAGSWQVFDMSTGYLSDKVATSSLDSTKMPGGTYPSSSVAIDSSTVWTTTSGVNWSQSTPTASKTGFLFKLSIQNASASFVDLDSQSSGVQGIALAGSHPVFMQRLQDTGKVGVLSLCRSDFGSACKSYYEEASLSQFNSTTRSSLSSLGYEYYSSVVAGASEGEVYAHVKSKTKDEYSIVKIDLINATASEMLKLSGSGLSLLMFDSSSKTLFIGAEEETDQGVLHILKDEKLVETVKTKNTPWNGVLK